MAKHSKSGPTSLSPEQLFELKSIWKGKPDTSWSFFCPLCRATRKISYSPRPTPKHFVQVGLSAVVFMLATWNWFNWKGIVAFVPMWIAFEIVYRSKVRVALNCPDCGFDPFLYLVDIKRARAEIETHWRKKFAEKGIPYPEPGAPKGRFAKAAAAVHTATEPPAETGEEGTSSEIS